MKNLYTTLACCALLLGMAACKTQNKNEALRSYSVLSTLEHQLSKSYEASDEALVYLKKDVKRLGNSREGLESIKRAELLKSKTANLIYDIKKIKNILIEKAGGGINPKTNKPKQALNIRNTQDVIREESPKLSRKLEKHVKWLGTEYKDLHLPIFPPLHKGPDGQSLYEAFFADAHLGDVLIMLSSIQSKVIRYEREVIRRLGV